MGFTGGVGEGRWHDDDVDVFHGAIEFRETQVVTDGQAYLAERRVDHFNHVAGFYGFFFVVLLVA